MALTYTMIILNILCNVDTTGCMECWNGMVDWTGMVGVSDL